MANIAPVVTNLGAGVKLVLWEQINADDQGAPVAFDPAPSRAVLVARGTLDDGGTYSLQGKCGVGGTFATLTSLGLDVTAAEDIELQAVATCPVALDGEDHFQILNDGQGTTEDGDFRLLLFFD